VFFIWSLTFRVLRVILVFFPTHSLFGLARLLPFWVAQTQCTLLTLCCSTWSLLEFLQTILVCHELFCVYQVSSWDLLSESSHIILALFQLFFVWCMFSLLALAVCSLDLCESFLFFSSCFSFGVAPFITIPILVFHLISHPLILSCSFHFLRLASRPEP